jgi:hypothetical protein
MLLPGQPPPETIAAAIGLIRQAPDSGYDCDGMLRMNAQLKSALDDNETLRNRNGPMDSF